MYFRENSSDQSGRLRFAGFSEPLDREQYQTSLVAIRAALELLPRLGYVEGSPARKPLEEAFVSVPPFFAEALRLHLIGGEGPLAKLFRYTLAPRTQRAMLQILVNKVQAFQRQKREELHGEEEENVQTTEELRQKICAKAQEIDAISQELCLQKGERSDACLSARAEALETHEQSRRKGIRCA